MKKVVLIILMFLLLGCSKEKIVTNIQIEDNLNIEYREEKYLYDFVNVENGSMITENHLIDSNKLGKQEIIFKYKNSKNRTQFYKFYVTIVDTTNPVIFASKKYTIKKGEKIDLVSKAVCGDNYTREMQCSVEGYYDINKVGEYDIKFTTNDESGNYNEFSSKLIVKENIVTSNKTSSYYLKDLIKQYKTDNTIIGIDVSKWQGDINWQKVKAANVEFAIIRIGYGHGKEGNMVMDSKYMNNITNAKKAGILVGLYFYSYAQNTTEAKEQAKWIIDTLNGEKLDLPIAFDWECWDKFMSYKINFEDLNDIANAFMDEITASGYKAMNYGSANYMRSAWDTTKYPTWLAYYTNNNTYEKDFYIWQAASDGKVDGIKGNVDLNILYKN